MADYKSIFDSISSQRAKDRQDEESRQRTALDDYNPTTAFIDSAVSAVPELFGSDALVSPEVERFRAENPFLGGASQFAGTAVPYVGMAKLGELPRVARALDKVGDAETFVGGAKRGAALFAPLEAGRVAGNAIYNPEELDDATLSAGVNLALEAFGGGVLGAFKSAGRASRSMDELEDGLNLRDRPQNQLEELKKLVADGKVAPEQLTLAQNKMNRLGEAIRLETLPEKLRYVDELADGDAHDVNRLFKTSSDTNVVRRRLVQSSSDFADNAARDEVLQKSGLGDVLESVQFPRHISFKTQAGAGQVQSALLKRGKFKSIGDGTYWNKEKDGLYVVAKKIRGGTKAAKDDEWVVFKTNNPAKVNPKGAKWGKALHDRNLWLREPKRVPNPENPLDVYDEALRLTDTVPMQSFQRVASDPSYAKQGVDWAARQLGLDAAQGSSELAKRGKEFVREYFAPAMYQFKGSPRARWVHQMSKAVYDKARAVSQGLMYGDEIVDGTGSLFKQLWKGSTTGSKFAGKPSIKSLIDSLDADTDLPAFMRVWKEQIPAAQLKEMFARGEISERAYNALTALDEIDQYLVNQVKQTQKVTGTRQFKNIEGHYMLSRTWDGDWRVPVHDQAGRLVYVASGRDRNAADKLADSIVQDAAANGKTFRRSEPMRYDTDADMDLAAQVAAGSPEYMTAAQLERKLRQDAARPKTFKARQGVEGYKTDYSKKELLEKLDAHVNYYNRYMAELTVNHQLGEEMAKLGIENPKLYNDLAHRLNAMAGKRGEVDKLQNQVLDKVLSPVLGKNSATKITSSLNSAMHNLQLGMFNMGFPVLNALTFMQTVLPKVAYTMTADSAQLARHYSWLPAFGTDGRPRGSFGMLDMTKMMVRSFKEMGNPDAEFQKLINRAINDGVIDPKFIEEHLGSKSNMARNFKQVLEEKEGYGKFIIDAGNFMANKSEVMARGHAFTVGHMLGRDFFPHIAGDSEALYRFAKEFTEQTMFNYGVADRPKIMTSPLGSMFGLFKNWQAHYMASMLEYVGEGYYRGNWNPLLWQMGGTASLGGVAALPMYGAADGFSRWATDQSLMTHIYERFGGDPDEMSGGTSDMIFHGLPTFLGLSLSGSTAAPLSDPARDASMLYSFVHWDRAKALGQAVGAAVDKFGVTGAHPIDSPEVRDKFIAALAPKAFARAAALTEDGAIKSLKTGNTTIEGLNAAEQIMYATGFMPRRVALAYEVNEELWKSQEKTKKMVGEYAKAWNEAEESKDWTELTKLMQRMMQEGIDTSSVFRSAKARKEKSSEDTLHRQFDPEDLFEFQKRGIVQ